MKIVGAYYMPNHYMRLILLQKKNVFWLLFSGKSIQNFLILFVRMTKTTRKPVKLSLLDWIKQNVKMT